jgi:carboxyl-terminal processing protease
MPARNVLFLVIVTAACLAAWSVRDRDPAGRRLGAVLAAADRVSLAPIDRDALIDAAVATVVARLDEDGTVVAGGEPQPAAAGERFGGVGLDLVLDEATKEPVVAAARVGAAAWKAGVRGGDRIVGIDGVPTRGLPLAEVARRLRGPPGEPVTLRIQGDRIQGDGRGGGVDPAAIVGQTLVPVTAEAGPPAAPREVTVVREIVLPDTVVGDRRRADGSWRWQLEDAPGIAVVRILAFGERTAAEFAAAVATIVGETSLEKGAGDSAAAGAGLVIDLRGTEGGSLAAAVAVCDRLVDEGVIVATRRRRGAGTAVDVVRATPEVAAGIGRVAVLVDHRTAGVAEVVAACLQDHGRAAVVGSRTAGRGAVQTLVPVGDGSTLRLTTAEHLRPAGVADPSRGRLQRPAGAHESARWGVAPDPGLSLEPTGAALERLASWRRDRDRPAGDFAVIQAAAVGGAAGDLAVAASTGPATGPCTVDAVLAAAVAWIRAPARVASTCEEPVESEPVASETRVDFGREEEAARDADEAVAAGM